MAAGQPVLLAGLLLAALVAARLLTAPREAAR
jgi:hypothetical protein